MEKERLIEKYELEIHTMTNDMKQVKSAISKRVITEELVALKHQLKELSRETTHKAQTRNEVETSWST